MTKRSLYFILKILFILESEKESECWGWGKQRERERESEADSHRAHSPINAEA